MSEIAFITPQEQALSRTYEDQRRLRLVSVVASSISMLAILTALVLTIFLLFQFHSPNPLYVVMTIVAWLDIGCYGFGVIAARHGRANLAALCICGGLMLTIGVTLVYSLATAGLTLFSLGLVLSLPLVVVISGVLGNTVFLIIVTAVSTIGGSAVLLLYAQAPVLEQNVFGIMLLLATMNTTPCVMLAIFQQSYRRTLRELGDVRIAYERAHALDDLKNQFIVSVNHELRNPSHGNDGAFGYSGYECRYRAPRASAKGDAKRHACRKQPAHAARQHSGRQPDGARLRRFYSRACAIGGSGAGSLATDRPE